MTDTSRPAMDPAAVRTEIDDAYERTRAGNVRAFETWVRAVELPLRASLRPFTRGVDVEAVLQEGLLRMWKLAPGLQLEGPNASLRYALRVVRNLALAEARRLQRFTPLELASLENLFEAQVLPDPGPDPGLMRLIRACIERLPARPRQALRARLNAGGRLSDRDLAADLQMTVNTFLQNIVRARRLVARCLARQGVEIEEIKA